MEKIKRAYYYFFYKLYKAAKSSSTPLPADFVAGITVTALLVCILFTILLYYNIFIDRFFNIEKYHIAILGIVVSAINIYFFVIKSEWKNYNKDFDKLSNSVNNKGGLIVFGLILFIISSLIFAFYLMSEIDWTKYN